MTDDNAQQNSFYLTNDNLEMISSDLMQVYDNMTSKEKSDDKLERESAQHDLTVAAETDFSPKRENGIISHSSDVSLESSRKKRSRKDLDGRWSKRFTWPEDLHRDFVSAIFDVGLKQASPSVILQSMPEHPELNAERVKSHLQKYRIHRTKSKKEFMAAFDATLSSHRALAAGGLVGRVALAAMNEGDRKLPDSAQAAKTKISPDDSILLPKLTEEEKNSPIGTSLGFLMGLFFSLKQQLIQQREREARARVQVQEEGTEAVPPIRSNLEQSTLMRQEMQSQMEFQNKMRALKQQELSKYRHDSNQADGMNPISIKRPFSPSEGGHARTRSMGEPNDQRARSNSLGVDDFFNDEMIDDHLFEFLMSEANHEDS